MDYKIKFMFTKQCTKIFLTLVVSEIIQILVSLILLAFGSTINKSIIIMITQIVGIFIPFAVLRSDNNEYEQNYNPTKYYDCTKEKCSTKVQLKLLVFGMAIVFAANLITSVITTFFAKTGVKLTSPEVTSSKSMQEFVVEILSSCVTPALVEEFAFRGVVMGMLGKFNSTASIVISAFSFAIFHANVPQFVFALILGLYLGFLRVKTNSLLLPIIFHFINNAYANIITTISPMFNETLFGLFYLLLIISVLSVGILSFISLKNSGELSLKSLRKNTFLPDKTCYRLSVSNPGFLVFIFSYLVLFAATIQKI